MRIYKTVTKIRDCFYVDQINKLCLSRTYMQNLNLKKVSKLISDKLNKDIEIIKTISIGGGYHSDGYILESKNNESVFY